MQDKPNAENDKRLAEHITFVHMTGHEPEKKGMKPLDMRLIRFVHLRSAFLFPTFPTKLSSRYVAMCKRKHPIVPESLTDRIVQMYVELRKDARNNKDTTFTSPRTLLAVVRMSTALVSFASQFLSRPGRCHRLLNWTRCIVLVAPLISLVGLNNSEMLV
jgi:DNA replication licensing factor MCM7